MNLRGPDIYRIGDIDRLTIGVNTVATVIWTWPKSVLVKDMFFAPVPIPGAGAIDVVEWNALQIQIIDERERAVFSDGVVANSASPWMLHVSPRSGRRRRPQRFRWYPLRKPVRAGDKWALILSQESPPGVGVNIAASLFFRFQDAA